MHRKRFETQRNFQKLTKMDLKKDDKNEATDKQIQSDKLTGAESQSITSEDKPAKRVKRQATEEQLNHPLHGVKLAQILERLVEHYGWEYLADRVKIRCFMYYPTMKSSLGFLRKTQWAREHVEDVYLDMLKEKKQ